MDRGRPSHPPSPGPGGSSGSILPLGTSRLKSSLPSNIDVPSFSAFQAQTPRVDLTSPVRRKPLPRSLSSGAPRLSPGGPVVGVGDFGFEDRPRTSFVEEPRTTSHRPPWLPTPLSGSPPLVVRDLDQFPRGQSPLIPPASENGAFSSNVVDRQPGALQTLEYNTSSPTRLNHVRLASDSLLHENSQNEKETIDDGLQRAVTMSLHPTTGSQSVHVRGDSRSLSSQSNDYNDPTTTRTLKPAGSNKITAFFGWRTSSPIPESSPTNFSSRSHSPTPSPLLPSPQSLSSSKSRPNAIDVPRANAAARASYFAEYGHPLPPPTPAISVQIEGMEEELREVSSELAGSIRREMELEDLVERLQYEATQGQGSELNRRTSDYFSDSGTSSVRYPLSDVGGSKLEDLEKMKRRSEQEKAQLKVDLSQKLQNERGQRKALELYINQLEDQVQQVDKERATSSGAFNRVRDLEGSLDDLRRRLIEERRVKENFEDLLTALRGEIEQHRNERDNLRDEVVPRLRARLEGLEGEATEFQQLTYENARMQQEIQALRNENATLVNARRLQLDMQQQSSRFNSIAEEDGPTPLTPMTKMGLTRSKSVAQGTVKGGDLSRSASLSRSNSVSAKERESRESLADRVRDIEMQRDALHRALKSLLDRQKYQGNEHKKRIKGLEVERDRALQSQSPRRIGYEMEVTNLRDEINKLRRRADDALEQKWQCEKGLGGLKKDLDRAEQETSSLRALLQEHDILLPEPPGLSTQDVQNGTYATSASLEKAYKELQATQALSIVKLRELWGQAPSTREDASTAQTMDLLLKSMSDAEAERDYAQKQAELYRAQAESLQEADAFHSGENVGLADQLRASANRVESLASQVRLQLEINRDLRQRLAEAVGRGEREQKNSATRINSMQGKLRSLEDKLMTAQQHSEEVFAHHEEEVRDMKESHNTQLQRLKGGLKTPTFFSPKTSPLSPLFSARSPRLDKTTSGMGMSMTEALRTETLERKVAELEGALGDADKEMEEVVSRMNMAQIEVMELQSARDEAMRQTRKLQAAINAEREKVDSLMK